MRNFVFSWMRIALALVALFGLLFAACGGGGEKVCSDAACLTEALAGAGQGSTVRLAPGTFEGHFSLPSGVSLVGTGADSTILKATGDGPVIELRADSTGSSIQNLGIEGDSGGGIYAEGSGDLDLADLSISVRGGFCVKVRDLASLTASNLVLSGNVTEGLRNTIQARPDPDRYALAGMAVVEVGQAQMQQVTGTGFASCGVLLYGTAAAWDHGEMHGLVGSGVHVAGSSEVTLRNLKAHDIWGGATPFGYGLVVSDGAHVVTKGATFSDNEVAGILMDHATGDHTDTVVTGNGQRGVWIQHCQPRQDEDTAVSFHGPGTNMDDNGGVAFGTYLSRGISLSDGHLSNTHTIPMIPYGEETTDMVQIGDAIEILGSDDLAFSNLVIDSNARAGVVVDGLDTGQEFTNVTFDNVSISGEGERGFVEQNGTATSTPDVISETLQNADLNGGELDVAKYLDIGNVPSPDSIIDVET